MNRFNHEMDFVGEMVEQCRVLKMNERGKLIVYGVSCRAVILPTRSLLSLNVRLHLSFYSIPYRER